MDFKQDIEDRIKSDFGNKSTEAFQIFQLAIQQHNYLKSDRVIRAIIFLSEKSIEKLKQNIETAISDTRDVMYWAEYINRDDFESAKRVRDFNKTFEDSEAGVEE